MSGAGNVTFTLNADAAGAKRGAAEAGNAFKQAGADADAAGSKFENANKRATSSAQAAASAFSAQGQALAKLIGQIDPTVAGLGKLDDQLNSLKKFKSSGAISGEDFTTYAAKIAAARNELTNITGATHGFGLQTNLAQREVTVLLGELARGNTARFESSLITLGRASGVLGLALSGAGAAVLGTVAAIGAAALAYAKAASEQDAFNKALIATGNYAATTTAQLVEQTSVIGGLTGHYGDAQEALTKLAASGQVSGKTLDLAAHAAVNLSTLTGEAIDKAVEQFVRLSGDPIKGAIELNDRLNILTLSVYDQIKALEEQGKTEEAAELATKAFSDALQQRKDAYVESLGPIAKAWDNVKTSIEGALDSAKKFLNQNNTQNAIVSQTRTGIANLLLGPAIGPLVAGYVDGLTESQDKLTASTKAVTLAQAAQQGGLGVLDKKAIDADSDIDKLSSSYDKNAERLKALQRVQNDFRALANATGPTSSKLSGVTQDANGVFSGGLVDTLDAAINKRFADTSGQHNLSAINAVLSALDNEITKGIGLADQLATQYQGPLANATKTYNDRLNTLGDALEALNTKAALNPQFAASAQYAQQFKTLSDAAADAGDAYDEFLQKAGSTDAILKTALGTLTQETDEHGKSAIAIKAASLARQVEQQVEKNGLTITKQQTQAFKDEVAARLALANLGDYDERLKEEAAQVVAQIANGGELNNVQKAQIQIENDLAAATDKTRDALLKKAAATLADAAAADKANATLKLQQTILSTVDQLIEGTRQGVISGESAFEALGKTAAQVLPRMANDFLKILQDLEKANGGTVDFGKALDSLGDQLKKELPALGQLIGTIAGGGGQGAQIGSSIGSLAGGIIGGIITSESGGWGAPIGAAIGGLLGGRHRRSGRWRRHARSLRLVASGLSGSRPYRAVQTPLGIFAADTDNLADDAYKAFEATVKGFDIQLAKLFDPAQLSKVQDALKGFSGKFSDITALLTARFQVILGTFDQTFRTSSRASHPTFRARFRRLLTFSRCKSSATRPAHHRTILTTLSLITEFSHQASVS
jgi:hypothetical protein